MAITNLNNSHLTAAQVTTAKTAVTTLDTALAPHFTLNNRGKRSRIF